MQAVNENRDAITVFVHVVGEKKFFRLFCCHFFLFFRFYFLNALQY